MVHHTRGSCDLMAKDLIRCPLGLEEARNRGCHSEPESVTHSRERRRVAIIVRELTTYIEEKLDNLAAKLDMATAGLVAIANRQLNELESEDGELDAGCASTLCKSSMGSHHPLFFDIGDSSTPPNDSDLEPKLECKPLSTTQDVGVQFMGIGCDARWASLLSLEDLDFTSDVLDCHGKWEPLEEPEAGLRIKVAEAFVSADAQEAEYTSFPKWFAMRWIVRHDLSKLRKFTTECSDG